MKMEKQMSLNRLDQLRQQPNTEQKRKDGMTPESRLVKLLQLIKRYEASNNEEKLFKIAKSMYESFENPSYSQSMKKAYSTESLRILNKLTKNKYSEAQYYLGIVYKEKESYKKAATYFEQSYQCKHALGTYELGQCYEYGLGKTKDIKMAETLYRKAAMVGYCQPAMIHLGLAYLYGQFGQYDLNEAVNWLEKATASLSNTGVDKLLLAKACYELYKIYALGDDNAGIIPSIETALVYLNMSAENGFTQAMLEITKLEKDNSQRIFYWMSKAAENNDLEAQINLATWYLCENTKIIKPDKALGFYWLQRASMPKILDNDNDRRNQGRIQYILGTYYETGIEGVIQPDENEALYWFGLGAKLGIKEAIEKMEEKRNAYNLEDVSLSEFVNQVTSEGFNGTQPESLILSNKEKEKLTELKRPYSSMTSLTSLMSSKDSGSVYDDNLSDINNKYSSHSSSQNGSDTSLDRPSKTKANKSNTFSHKLKKIIPKKLCM